MPSENCTKIGFLGQLTHRITCAAVRTVMEQYKISYVWPKFEYFWLQSHCYFYQAKTVWQFNVRSHMTQDV